MKYPTCLLSVTKDIGGIKSLSDVFVALQLSFGSVGDAIAKMAAAASSGAGVFGTLSAGAAALSGTLVPIVAIAAAVAAGIYAISKAYVSASEANDKMRDSYSAYQEAQSNLESVNSELDTTKASMDELLGKEHLTFVEEAELQKLKDATEQLLIQQDLAEREENKAARQAAEDTVSAYKKNFKNEISADETKDRQDYAQTTGNNVGLTTDPKDVSAMLAAIKQFDALKQEAKDELAKAQKDGNESDIEWLEEDIKHYDELNQELTDSIWDQVKLLTEYRDKLKALPEDELAKVDGASDVLSQIDDQIAYIYSELDPAAWKQMQFDEILNSDEYKKAKDELTELAKATDGAGISVDDVKEKYPELASAIEGAGLSISDFVDLINSSAEATDDAGEAVVSNAERIQNAVDDTTKATQELTSQIDAVQSVLNGQMTGKSISVEDFNSDELADYRSALEYVNGTMQLNADKVAEIAKAKADEQVAINNTNKALAQSQYLENARQIEQYRQQLQDASFAEGETADSIQASIDALLNENSAIADTCAQYDLLSASIQEAVGAYQHWLNAQSASDYGDMANDTVSAIQQIRDTYDANSDIYGNFGSKKFEAAVDFIVPDSVDREDLGAIESYMSDFKQYLRFDDDGVVEGLDIDKFLQKSVDAGLMSYSEDDGFKVLGGKKMEDFAEGLNLSSGVVQAFFDELQLKGAEFDWGDEAVKTVGDLAVEANKAAESLRQLDGNSDLKIKMDVSDLSTTEEQVNALDATIAEMDGIKARPDVDASSIDNANAVIQYCLTQKQLLSQPDVMRVDTSQVEGEVSNAISLLQQFQNATNELEIKQKVGADTSEAESQVNSLASEIQNISPEIKAQLNIDSTSVESIQSSINGLSAETIEVKAGVDASAIEGYHPDSKTCDVIYDPKTDLLPTSFPSIDRTVNYVANTANLPGSFDTITRYVNYIKTGDVSVNGTAHADGTARAGGDWGTAPGGRTLVGELGREIVVDPRTGKWYTVGDNGAEFRDIPAGAIVFNHKQTESLLANGYVAGRASALVSGTAMVTGGYRPYKPSSSSTSRRPSSSNNGSSSRSSSTGSSSSRSSSSRSNSNKNKEFEKTFDFIAIAVDRATEAIDRLKVTADSAFQTLSTRNKSTVKEISAITKKINVENKAYKKYMAKANSLGLSQYWVKKIKNGSIDIRTVKDEDLADKIQEYQDYYERAIEARDAVAELREDIASLYKERFDNISNDFENQISLLEHLTNTYDNGIDNLEARGYFASTKLYEAMKNVEKQNIAVHKKELSSLIKAMSEAVKSGAIKEGSEAWYDMQNDINAVKESIQESETAILEFNNSIREIKWERFEYLQEQISNITDEANFMIDLMENSDLFTDNGKFTDTGMATLGLHGQNYNVYMAQADKYAEELKKLNADIAKDPNNTTLLQHRQELLEAQRDSILAAEDEKQAIKDLVADGIEKELDALQDLIDKYTEAMDTAKDLHDYQKDIEKQSSEIAKLQKQLSAYSGDNSEETRATIQKIQVDLADAMDDLEETQYEHYISEQKKLLDNLYDEYEAILNERLDNIDALISDMIDTINANSASISTTLQVQSDKVGYDLSTAMKSIWSNEGGGYSIITKYGDSFLTQMTSVNDVITKIAYKIGAMVKESDNQANQTVSSATPSTKTDTSAKPPTSNKTEDKKPTKKPSKKTKFNDDIKRGVAAAIWIYGSKSGWGNDPDRKKRLTAKFGASNAAAVQKYINAHANNGDLYDYWVKTGKSKLSQYYYSAFKKGGLADYTGVAWLDGSPTEPEMVLNPEDTQNFIALKDAMRSIADGNNPLSKLFGGDECAANVLSQLAKVSAPMSGKDTTNIGDITYQVTIPIEHVQDYNDFMNQMRKDGKFEKMIRSMTVDQLSGGSKLSKNKYQW